MTADPLSSLFNTDRIDHLYQDPHLEHRKLILHYGDLTDSMNITRLVQEVQSDEIYNLAAMSHVHVSFQTPEYVGNADGLGTLRILEAVRLLGLTEKTRIYQASTSELYGLVQEVPQRINRRYDALGYQTLQTRCLPQRRWLHCNELL